MFCSKPGSSPQLRKKGPPSAADKEEAERLKTEGNNLMRTFNFIGSLALDMYSKVTISDIVRRLDFLLFQAINLAHSSLNKHKEDVENFKKALELEPDNES